VGGKGSGSGEGLEADSAEVAKLVAAPVFVLVEIAFCVEVLQGAGGTLPVRHYRVMDGCGTMVGERTLCGLRSSNVALY